MSFVLPLDSAMAEFIFAPFHDHEHAPTIPTQLDAVTAVGVRKTITWCSTTISWERSQPDQMACEFRFYAPFIYSHHDILIASLSLPDNVSVQVALLKSDFRVATEWTSAHRGKGSREELCIAIRDLLRFRHKIIRLDAFQGVGLRFTALDQEPAVVALSWFALRNGSLLQAMTDQRRTNVPNWDPWLLPVKNWGNLQFERGLLFDYADLKGVQRKKTLVGWRKHFALLESRAHQYLKRKPEADFGDYLPNHDSRYIREHEQGRTAYHWEALVLGFVGLVNNDQKMMQHALRYLMCMVHTRYWADSAEHRIPSSTWNQRSFMEEMTTTSVALLADWFACALTPQAKSLIRHALWDKGMAPVKRDLMQFEYMHRMNQGAVFCRAGILGGLMLETAWPRVSPHVEESYETMKQILRTYIKADGGVVEGVGYLCQTLTAALWGLIAYSKARGRHWQDEARDLFGNVERFVRAMSAMEPGKAMPCADCRVEWFSGDSIPILATAFKDSAYTDILSPCLENGWIHELTGTLAKSGGLVGMVYGPDDVKEGRSIVPDTIVLPQSGKVSFIRKVKDHSIRLLINANPAHATHAHRDHTGFCLEVDSIPVFIDRGMTQYWNTAVHHLYKSWLHNVITPVIGDHVFPDQDVSEEDPVIDECVNGDRTEVRVRGVSVWKQYMKTYDRRFSSTSSEPVVVTESGALYQPAPMAFHLQSLVRPDIHHTKAIFRVGPFSCSVEFDWAARILCNQALIDFAGRPVYHVCAISTELLMFDLATSMEVSWH